ncbi:MAG: T9SS type A sorting domain-containing protein, partial [Tannerella sp.]|nr:T9SS type A sorting domain-containing protein [Tannerella sp.]
PDYLSLRGAAVKAQSGIMRYDTLTVYGDVELHANFEPETDPTGIDFNFDNQDEPDKIWAAASELFVRTSKPGSIIRIYSTEGVLQRQQVLLQAGETKIKLPDGLYIVTLNNGIGKKIIIRY